MRACLPSVLLNRDELSGFREETRLTTYDRLGERPGVEPRASCLLLQPHRRTGPTNAVLVSVFAGAALVLSVPAAAKPLVDPLSFFEGRTESSGSIKVLLQNPYLSHSVGQGHIAADGSLSLVQQVFEQGKPPAVRRWQIRKTASGHYAGTMSDANGPVAIDQIGDRFRFRFKLKNNLSVEQWVGPLSGGALARNLMTVRKFGFTVATGDGIIRKIAGG